MEDNLNMNRIQRGVVNNVRFDLQEHIRHEKEILRTRRKELGLSMNQVAEISGIFVGQYQKFESGERLFSNSSARIMLSVCETLMLDPYIFMEGKIDKGRPYLVLPPIDKNGEDNAIPQYAYFLLVSAIPYGKVCSVDDVLQCLREAYRDESLEIKLDENSFCLYSKSAFPYWRIVSANGSLLNNVYSSKQRQRKLLENEGLEIVKNTNEELLVKNFKSKMFDLGMLKITVMER